MKRIKMFKQNIGITLCEDEGRTQFLLFEDNALKIDAQVFYDNNSKVEKMIFQGNNKGNENYAIKHITFCPDNNFDWGDRFLIHIDKTSTPGSNIKFTIDKHYNAALLSKLSFIKKSVSPFFFKEYVGTVPSDYSKLDCKMQMVTPKTKDGSIIISVGP